VGFQAVHEGLGSIVAVDSYMQQRGEEWAFKLYMKGWVQLWQFLKGEGYMQQRGE
jgi:hypothetical protein